MPNDIALKDLVGASRASIRKPTSLADEAADALRGMILLEKLPPGTALPERELSEALGISRTPMREAIRQLTVEGLIEVSPSRRPFVADPTIDEINDYLRVQGALEALSGRLACEHASDAELDAIAGLNAVMNERYGEDDPLVSFERDMAFHEAIVAAGRNEPLAQTHATYNARLWRARFLSSQRKACRNSKEDEHQQIVDALLARDAEATAHALQHHLASAETNIANAIHERENQQQDTVRNAS